jgi:hypothetical protein
LSSTTDSYQQRRKKYDANRTRLQQTADSIKPVLDKDEINAAEFIRSISPHAVAMVHPAASATSSVPTVVVNPTSATQLESTPPITTTATNPPPATQLASASSAGVSDSQGQLSMPSVDHCFVPDTQYSSPNSQEVFIPVADSQPIASVTDGETPRGTKHKEREGM